MGSGPDDPGKSRPGGKLTIRTTERTVRFNRAFTLAGSDHAWPPGEYLIQTDEEMLEQMSFTAWKRVATTILLREGGTIQSITVDPAELERMLSRDVETGAAS
jgi:FKBP-type peptidyl-prolyl cis-trans isomerase (trigger factor)